MLHRHLKSDCGIQSEVVRWQRFPFRLKLIGKLRQLGFQFLSRSWECLFPVFPPTKMIREFIERYQPNVLITVAHGAWHMQARRIAEECGLPLVAFFQDWWPDFPDVPAPFRSRVEREFRRTCKESAVAICISDEMQRELGEGRNTCVIYPIPSFTKSKQPTPDFTLPLRLAYFGNLYEYGPPIESALRALNGTNKVRLEVFGSTPLWTPGTEDYFRSEGLYHGFIPANELAEPLRHFQAVLVVMSFDDALRRRMTTSFPSKMSDAMQLGLPIVVWGPEYCSAVQWARRGDRALCVSDPNPLALRQALEQLATSPAEQERLGKSAREAAASEFNCERIQAQFVAALERAMSRDM